MTQPQHVPAFPVRFPDPVSMRGEHVEPGRFLELLLSRRRIVRVAASRPEELALRDTQTGSLFVVEAERFRTTLAGV